MRNQMLIREPSTNVSDESTNPASEMLTNGDPQRSSHRHQLLKARLALMDHIYLSSTFQVLTKDGYSFNGLHSKCVVVIIKPLGTLYQPSW